jgi:hypothetical protein
VLRRTAALEIGADISIEMRGAAHPLLGTADAICSHDEVLTWLSVIDWDLPREVPAIAEPGRLPNGAGALVMNELARRATEPLRYAGPYPTPALWRALARSFHARGGDEALFTADLMGRAARLARDPIDIEFLPRPHVRVSWPRGWSEVRDGVERIVVDGIGYEANGSPARLVDGHAELWFGDALYARIATVGPTGALIGGPHVVPPLASRVLGQEFPPPLREAIAELVADLVPPPLADAARARVAGSPIRWADLGARAARVETPGFALHAALWERIAPLGLPRLALAIAEALAPAVTSALLADLSRVSVSG